MTTKTSSPTFIVRSQTNPALIFCTNGDWMTQSLVGPGGYCAKVYKTRAGAERVRGGHGIIIEEVQRA